MSGNPSPINPETLLAVVEQMLQICTQVIASCEALESLLIDKGVLTREELDARMKQQRHATEKIVASLASPKMES
jgi:DUF1009 family protein